MESVKMHVQKHCRHYLALTCRTAVLVAFAAVCMFIRGLHADVQNSVRLTNGHWPPYMAQALPGYGVISDIVTRAFAIQKTSVTYGFFPWSRALLLAETGSWDGSVAWTCRPEMLEKFYFSDPLIAHHYVLFHRADMDFDWKNVEDLEAYRLGTTQDYNYGDAFKEAVAYGRITSEETVSDVGNFRKLGAGRIDLFPMEPVVGQRMLKDLGLGEKITFHPEPLQSDYLYLILPRGSENSEGLLKKFNRGLEELRLSGELNALVNAALPDLPAHYALAQEGNTSCIDP